MISVSDEQYSYCKLKWRGVITVTDGYANPIKASVALNR